MSELTLREVCVKYDVSRRAIQGYEKHRLIAPTGKTDRGYLLYDERAQKKICTIKRLQDCGFRLAEIQKLCISDPHIKKEMLQNRYDSLLEYQDKLAASIAWLSKTIANL